MRYIKTYSPFVPVAIKIKSWSTIPWYLCNLYVLGYCCYPIFPPSSFKRMTSAPQTHPTLSPISNCFWRSPMWILYDSKDIFSSYSTLSICFLGSCFRLMICHCIASNILIQVIFPIVLDINYTSHLINISGQS